MRHLMLSLALACPILSGCATPPDLTALEASVTADAARVPPSLALTSFGQSIQVAVARSPGLGRGTAALREAEAGLIAVNGAYLPEVSVGLRPDNSVGFGVRGFGSLSLLVYDGGANAAHETAARARVLGGIAGRHNAASQAALDAVQAWSDVVTARALHAASEVTLAALETTVARIEERTAAGAGASGEVLTARSRIANERAMIVAAQAEVARAEAVFFEVFGHSPSNSLALPQLAPRMPADGLAASPLLLIAEADVLAAEAELAAVIAGRTPTLALTVSALTGSRAIAGVASEQLLAPTNNRRSQISAAEARIDARRTDLDATQRALQSRLRIIGAEIDATERRVGAAQEASAANRENLSAARDQFDVGRQGLLDLLDSEREALAAERQRIMAEHDRIILSYAALAATGDILDLFGITLETDARVTDAR